MSDCGTYGGYQSHRKAGDDICEPCRRAHRDYMRQWRSKDSKREQGRVYTRAQRRAISELITRHRDEYDDLLAGERLRDLEGAT